MRHYGVLHDSNAPSFFRFELTSFPLPRLFDLFSSVLPSPKCETFRARCAYEVVPCSVDEPNQTVDSKSPHVSRVNEVISGGRRLCTDRVPVN